MSERAARVLHAGGPRRRRRPSIRRRPACRSTRPRRSGSTRLRGLRRDDRVPHGRATPTRAATGIPTLAARSRRRWPPSRARRRRSAFASGHGGDPHRVHDARARAGDRDRGRANELYGGTYSLATKVLPRYGVDGRSRRSARPRRGRGGAARRGALLRRDDREPQRDRRRPRGARGALPRRGRAGRRSTTRSPRRTCATRPAAGSTTCCHSATKYIGGHHDLIGGVVCTSSEGRARAAGRRDRHRRDDGAVRGVALPAGTHDAGAPHGSPRRDAPWRSPTFARGPPEGRARALPRARSHPQHEVARTDPPARMRRA